MVKSGGRVSYNIRNDPTPIIMSNELKYKDTAWTVLASSAGTVFPIDVPTQGVGATQRLGDRARILKLENVGFIYTNNSGAPADQLRYIVFQEKGKTAGTPAVTDLLTVASPYAPFVYNARDQFEIIHDIIEPLSYNSRQSVTVREAFVPPIKEQKFVSGSNTLYSGQIYMLIVAANTGNSNYNGNMRLWFEDSN